MSLTLQQQGAKTKEALYEKHSAGNALAMRVIRHSVIYQERLGFTGFEVRLAEREHGLVIARFEDCDLVASTVCMPHYGAGDWRTVIMALGPACETMGGGTIFLSALPDSIFDRAIRGN